MRRFTLAALSLIIVSLLAPANLDAQIPRPRGPLSDEPRWWASVWGGYMWSNTIQDPSTTTVWNFDSGWAIRGTLERTVASRLGVGVAWSYARVPLGYFDSGSCGPCVGDATIATYGLLARSGGGLGFHQVYEAFLGAMRFGSFQLDQAPASAGEIRNTDLAFSVGYGVGYGVSRDWQLMALIDYGNNVHERSTAQFVRRISQHYTLRMGARVGF